jgi:TolB-like protein
MGVAGGEGLDPSEVARRISETRVNDLTQGTPRVAQNPTPGSLQNAGDERMEQLGSTDIFLFEGFRFDRAGRCLFRTSGPGVPEPVALGSRALALLGLFIERQGQLVSKDDIMKIVWSGMAVEEANLTMQISALRRILDRDREQGSWIQTVPGRGYRFIPPVVRTEPSASATEHRRPGALALPDKPSIAVLPFVNLSGDIELEYFADGMVEEIITAPSRIRWLFVVARNSSFTYKGEAIDVKRVGSELGVRYVLEGSVRKSGSRVRIAAQLIEACCSGVHLWADRFDGSLEDAFELQDRVASNVAAAIVSTLHAAETACSAARPIKDLTAYDLYLRAYAMVRSSEQIHEALHLMEQAIERDPDYGPALAWAAVCCARLLMDGRSADRVGDALKGAGFARRAFRVAGDDPGVLVNAAFALAFFGEDIDAMIALVDRVLSLNPSFARGWQTSGVLRTWAGQTDMAIEHAETSLRLNPRGRTGVPLFVIGAAHFLSRRFDQALPKLLLPIQQDPSFLLAYYWLAACYALMGRLTEARDVLRRLRSMTSVVVTSESYLRNADHRELLLSGLRLAGVSEE